MADDSIPLNIEQLNALSKIPGDDARRPQPARLRLALGARYVEPPWQAARQAAAKRSSFFTHILILTSYVVFPSWSALEPRYGRRHR
jgi:hypothetical protein